MTVLYWLSIATLAGLVVAPLGVAFVAWWEGP